ncbi:MAG: DUF4321 domain-containing protein [Clostridiales bacterium]|jgi:hypothetical protein|nr:DUF4321 domain-containing protein [Clostridiales bacterium]
MIVLILVMLAGIVGGGFLGELITKAANGVEFLSFLNVLNYSAVFGLTDPVTLDLSVISLTLGLTVRFSVWGLIGMAAALLLYRKI